jgi:TP901 family phage tail tape measure protein
MPTLQVAIDASKALQGANVFAGAAKTINIHASATVGNVTQLNNTFNRSGTSALAATPAFASMLKVFLGFVGIRAIINTLSDFDTGVAGVRKTTNMTMRDIGGFEEAIISLSTRIPVSTNELLEIAKAAGQLGVRGTGNLVAFTEIVAKMGVSANVSGELAATKLAQILNITGEGLKGTAKLADAIVNLGNNTAVAGAEDQILRITNEVARGTNVFKVSAIEAAGLAAALGQLGTRAESAGTATYKVLRTLDQASRANAQTSKQLKEVSSIVGVSPEEFKKMFGESSIDTLQKFTAGLDRIMKAGGSVDHILGELGLKDNRLRKSFQAMSKDSEQLARALSLARNSAGALDREAGIAFGTMARQWQLFKNTLGAGILQLRDSKGILTETLGVINQALRIAIGVEPISDKASQGVKNIAAAFVLVGRSVKAIVEAFAILIGVRSEVDATSTSVLALERGMKILLAVFIAYEAVQIVAMLNNARLAVLGLSLGLTGAVTAGSLLMVVVLGVGVGLTTWAISTAFITQLKFVQTVIDKIASSFAGAAASGTGFFKLGIEPPGTNAEANARAENLKQIGAVNAANIAQGIDPQFKPEDLKKAFQDNMVKAIDAMTSGLTGFIKSGLGMQGIVKTIVAELEKGTASAKKGQVDYHDAVDEAIFAMEQELELSGKRKVDQDLILQKRKLLTQMEQESVLTYEEMAEKLELFTDAYQVFVKEQAKGEIKIKLSDLKYDAQLFAKHGDALEDEISKRAIIDEYRKRGIKLDQDTITIVERETAANNKLKRSWDQVWSIADQTGNAFGNFLTDSITGVKSLGDAFVELGKTIQRAVIDELISKPIAKWATSVVGNGLGSLFGLGTAPASSAQGNVFTQPGLSWFGEGGKPEAVVPLARGTDGNLGIRMQGGGGGGGPTVIINVNGVQDAASFKKSSRQITDQIRRQLG